MGTNIQSYQHHTHAAPQKTCLNITKICWLRSTSGLAMTVSEKSRMFAQSHSHTAAEGQYLSAENLSTETLSGLGSILWVMHWILRLTLGRGFKKYETPDMFRVASEPTHARYQRLKAHMERRKSVPVARLTSRLFRILSRRMTYGQYREFLVRMSISGRVRIYGLKYAGSVLQRRALLSCVDHGWWRMPQTSAVGGGMWEAQLPDN